MPISFTHTLQGSQSDEFSARKIFTRCSLASRWVRESGHFPAEPSRFSVVRMFCFRLRRLCPLSAISGPVIPDNFAWRARPPSLSAEGIPLTRRVWNASRTHPHARRRRETTSRVGSGCQCRLSKSTVIDTQQRPSAPAGGRRAAQVGGELEFFPIVRCPVQLVSEHFRENATCSHSLDPSTYAQLQCCQMAHHRILCRFASAVTFFLLMSQYLSPALIR